LFCRRADDEQGECHLGTRFTSRHRFTAQYNHCSTFTGSEQVCVCGWVGAECLGVENKWRNYRRRVSRVSSSYQLSAQRRYATLPHADADGG